jgi:hypothetical protein
MPTHSNFNFFIFCNAFSNLDRQWITIRFKSRRHNIIRLRPINLDVFNIEVTNKNQSKSILLHNYTRTQSHLPSIQNDLPALTLRQTLHLKHHVAKQLLPRKINLQIRGDMGRLPRIVVTQCVWITGSMNTLMRHVFMLAVDHCAELHLGWRGNGSGSRGKLKRILWVLKRVNEGIREGTREPRGHI